MALGEVFTTTMDALSFPNLFIAVNILIAIACVPLSRLVILVFRFWRRLIPPEKVRAWCSRFGFQGSEDELTRIPGRREVIMVLCFGGVINAAGMAILEWVW